MIKSTYYVVWVKIIHMRCFIVASYDKFVVWTNYVLESTLNISKWKVRGSIPGGGDSFLSPRGRGVSVL